MSIDWKFIEEQEGFELKGYVPMPDTSNSGVTIASGIDLGQLTIATLNSWAISSDLKSRLAPYIGLKKYQAVAALRAQPLTITEDEGLTLNTIIKIPSYNYIKYLYTKNSKVAFDNILPAAQTVIASVSFQYGNIQVRCPSFWKAIIVQNWDATLKELRNFGDAYGPRRNREANYLAKALGK